MLETKEQEITPVEGNSQLPEEINKYHKRIDDLIEDAEIEAEIEAEKKIRSKNSRMFSISMIGIAFLGLVYFQVQSQSSPVEPLKEAQLSKPETAEEKLAKQVPIVEDASTASSVPVPQAVAPAQFAEMTNPFVKPSEIKSIKPPSKPKVVKKSPEIKKVSTKSPASSKKVSSPEKNSNSRFFIQAGAFGVEKNAQLLVKQLKAKGYAPSIETRSQKLSQHVVTVGNFSNKKSGESTAKELSIKGFNTSTYKTPSNSFSLKVGQFNNIKDSQKLQDRLSLKGFLSESHKAVLPVTTYIVQLGVFPTREKAILTQEKLARAGYSKTFVR